MDVLRPVGTWAIITPWNYPLLMFAEFVAPGLATGNAHVVKPPAHTAFTVLAAMEVLREAGLPEGLVSVLPGEGVTGVALITHPGIDAIGFIGSSATGAKIQASAGPQALDYGVFGQRAAYRALRRRPPGRRRGRGLRRRTVLRSGLLRHRASARRPLLHGAFVEALLAETDVVRLGDPFDAKTTLGPLNNEAVAAKMDAHLADAHERGAELLRGGQRRAGDPTDLYYEFTVVDHVPADSLLATLESFGPVVPVIIGRHRGRVAGDR